jgi:hypothetical protein
MDDQEFERAVNQITEANAGTMTLIERMSSLTEAQKQRTIEILARQGREHEDYLKNRIGAETQAELARRAWEAARRAARDADSDANASQRNSWPVVWIALVLIGVILLLLKFFGGRLLEMLR